MFPLLAASLVLISNSVATGLVSQDGQPKNLAVVELFEDDADGLLKVLTNPGDAPGQGAADLTAAFSGKSSLKITQYQRFNRAVPGWNHEIREKPKPGEYRYLRLAWKAD